MSSLKFLALLLLPLREVSMQEHHAEELPEIRVEEDDTMFMDTDRS